MSRLVIHPNVISVSKHTHEIAVICLKRMKNENKTESMAVTSSAPKPCCHTFVVCLAHTYIHAYIHTYIHTYMLHVGKLN